MQTLQTQTARTIIYFFCIGGLLTLHSFFLMFMWNNVLHSPTSINFRVSFLEGAGITAFAYVIVIAYKYGKKGRTVHVANESAQQTSPASFGTIAPRMNAVSATADYEPTKACAKLSPEDRERLRQELISKCGCSDTTNRLSA